MAGTLTTGNLTMTAAASGATFFVAPGAGDRIAVRGSIRLGGGLEVFAQAGYTPHLGDRFTLIANDGTDLAVGTFAGVPEGGVVGRGSALFRITYRGGDGSTTTLRDTVFSTVPGSPAYVSKASSHTVNLPQYGMVWSFEGRNAIQSDYRITFEGQ